MFNIAARGGSSGGLSPLQRSGLRTVTALAVTGAITAPLVGIATAQTGSLGSSGSGGSTPPASSTTPTSSATPPTTTTPPPAAVRATVELRVLVLDDGSFSGEAFATRLAAEGVEVDRIDVTAAGRQPLTREMLADDATRTARYMGIVSAAADRTALSPAENALIDQFTADYGIREVSANVTPVADVGLVPTTSGMNFDATTATLTPGALAGEWSYLDGALDLEDLSPTVAESWGYAATPAAGAQFEPLLTSAAGAGVMMGVHTQGTRERLVMTVAMNQYQHHFKALSHGIITWLTRGVSTSLYRNVFNVQIDDVFLADDEWNPVGDCTFGVNCDGEPAPGALTDSRMVASDVAAALEWQARSDIELDMTFNAFGAGDDGLTSALLGAKDQLRWVNHTWDHTNLDRLDEAAITAQIQQNITWAQNNTVPLDPTELVTGQHSGTASGPARTDNPALLPALGATGVTWVAGDASIEPNQRPMGDALTVPRHPMNVYYNTSTEANAVDEYNWIYTTELQGGSGTCGTNGASTCLPAPLPLDTGFRDYIAPQEARHALSHALSMDPRPHYVHQSNITGDRILYPVLDTMVGDYRAMFDEQSAPLDNPSLAELGREMQRRAAWAEAADSVTATVRGSTLVIENDGATSVDVPVTTRGDSAFDGDPYAGSKSAWVTVPAGGELVIELGDDVGFLTPSEDPQEPAVAPRALPQAARAASSPSPAQNSVVIPPINDATRVGAVGEGPSARG